MKQENRTIRALFDPLSPDSGQIAGMEQKLLHAMPARPDRVRCRPPMKLVLAAALVLALSITAVSAAPALRQYFFPGLGIVETDADAPLYLMAVPDEDTGSVFDVLYGRWLEGEAQVWVRSGRQYENMDTAALFDGRDGTVELRRATKTVTGAFSQIYLLTIPGVSVEDTLAGLAFDGGTIHFDRMPAQYRTYTAEDTGLRLTLIPLTTDMTTFSIELTRTDSPDVTLSLSARSDFGPNNAASPPALRLVDSEGNEYPLTKMDDTIYTLQETPASPIVGFRSDTLCFGCSFDGWDNALTVPLPAEGETTDTPVDFTFPDGIPGRLRTIGRNHPVVDEASIDCSEAYPMGYMTIVTDSVEHNGIRYWSTVTYADSYYAFLEPYLVMEGRSPYDTTPLDPMAPKCNMGPIGDGSGYLYRSHYIHDGSDTMDLQISRYTAIASGDWSVDFAPNAE